MAASKVLSLILDLAVTGAKDAVALEQSIEKLKKGFAGLKFDKALFNTTPFVEGKRAVSELEAALTKLTLSLKAGRTPVDFDVTKGTAKLDLLVQKGGQAIDLLAKVGKTPITLDTNKAEASLFRLSRGFRALREFDKSALKPIKDGIDGVGEAADRASKSTAGLTSSALFLRRALIGLGFVAVARSVLDAVVAFDRLDAQLKAVFGGKSGENLAFIREQADRLGISITDLGSQFAKFATATKGTTLEGQKTRDIFLAIAEAGAALSLSAENIEGTLSAVQQIASKGTLSLEELRQQLGDRLPGALQIAAKALGVTTARLDEMIRAGQVDAFIFLEGFGQAVRNNFGTDQNTRITTISAGITRLQNALQEFSVAVTKGKGVEEFTRDMDALVKVLKDPATVETVKTLIGALASLIRFIAENVDAIKTIVGAFALFKGLEFVSKIVTGISVALGGLRVATVAFSAAAPVAATAATGLAAGFAALLGPIGLLIALYAGLDAAVKLFVNRLLNSAAAAREVEASTARLARNNGLKESLIAQADALKDYASVLPKTAEEIKKFTAAQVGAYLEVAVPAQAFFEVQRKQFANEIAANVERIAALKRVKNATNEQLDALDALEAETEKLTKAQEANNAKILEFESSLRAAREEYARLTRSAKELDGITFDKLTKAQQNIVSSFKKVIETSGDVNEALANVIPKNFGTQGIQQITDVLQALRALQNEGVITGEQLKEALGKALEGLSGKQLEEFQKKVTDAFKEMRIGVKAFDDSLRAAVESGLSKFGTSAIEANKNVSKSFDELLKTLKALQENAKITGAELAKAITKAVETAKTKEELDALAKQLEKLRSNAGKFGDALVDAFTRMDDKIRMSAGLLDSALGDSFARLGVLTKTQLNAIAEQAAVDFNRIKDSGIASLEELKAAFAKFAAEALKATGGILPIKVKIQALELDAFDVIVKGAEVAADRVKQAFVNALSNANTKAQLEELKLAIENTFASGRISAGEYKTALDQIATKTFELAQATTDGLGGALARLGVQTRDQLKGLAEQLRLDFQQLSDAGVLTTEQLRVAFEKYAASAIAANDGVVDSFLEGQAGALGLEDVLDKLVDKAGKFNKIIKDTIALITTPAFDKLSDNELLKNLDGALKGNANRRGFTSQGVIDDLIAELKKRGLDQQGNRLNNGQPQVTTTTNNFNFNSPSITPEAIKNTVVPALHRQGQRTQ